MVFAVFVRRTWQRDLLPLEIFHDLDEANKFIEKWGHAFVQNENDECMIYMRTPTDWELIKNEKH